ncbi:ADP-ribosylation factor-like protein 2-binding protein [Dinochytrium kinnereticum]|nr:ADP-ribosylation factor-like protein 2-binding protein [Dinochytrium kinnereticum]
MLTIADDKFIDLQTKFLDKYCHNFTNDDENKLIYMDAFNQYTKLLERTRSDQADGDVFEMLTSLGDFNTFKELMLSYKNEKEGTNIDLSGLLAVSSSRK